MRILVNFAQNSKILLLCKLSTGTSRASFKSLGMIHGAKDIYFVRCLQKSTLGQHWVNRPTLNIVYPHSYNKDCVFRVFNTLGQQKSVDFQKIHALVNRCLLHPESSQKT